MPSILIVDDESTILGMLRLAFVQAGYDVVTAKGGEEAMSACRQRSFDVLLSDVQMPGMDGHELARRVAENYPQTRTVLMSGYDLECQECPYSPRCHLVDKPFRLREVVQTVGRLLVN